MQNFNKFNDSDYISDAPDKLNDNFQSIASDFAGTSFPTTDLVEGMTCYRTDEGIEYRYVGGKWVSPFATQAQAEEGVDNTKVMTPLRTKQLASKNYLPLDGGIMGGGIIFTNNNENIRKNTSNSFLYLTGGTTQSSGCSLLLFGEDYNYSGFGGGFELRTAIKEDGTYPTLKGKNDGTLTWNGKNIVTYYNIESVGLTLNASELEIIKAMPNYSELIFYQNRSTTSGAYMPNLSVPVTGMIRIRKMTTNQPAWLEVVANDNKTTWFSSSYYETFSGWEKLATNGALSMPSSYRIAIDNTITTYIAPVDGWFVAVGSGTDSTSHIQLVADYTSSGGGVILKSGYSYGQISCYVPLARGQQVHIQAYGATITSLYFTYAQSEV